MAPAAKLSGEQRPELQYPTPHRIVGDIQTALGEQILDIPQAEGEASIEPHPGNWGAQSRCLAFTILPAKPRRVTVPVSKLFEAKHTKSQTRWSLQQWAPAAHRSLSHRLRHPTNGYARISPGASEALGRTTMHENVPNARPVTPEAN
jgi:hypothetical protein